MQTHWFIHKPTGHQLDAAVVDAIWQQTGGQPCTTQYLMHELWATFEGELTDATVADALDCAETFEDRTKHFSSWAKNLGRQANRVYAFLVERNVPCTYSEIRECFPRLPATELQSALDALRYHGVVHDAGRGRRTTYAVGGQLYRDWFVRCFGTDVESAPPEGRGLASGVVRRLQAALVRCGPFEDVAALRSIFIDSRIRLWRDRLPSATDAQARACRSRFPLLAAECRRGQFAGLVLACVE